MENITHCFRETNLVLISESPSKCKTVTSWSLRKKKENIFCPKEIVLTFMFYFNVECIEYILRIYRYFYT